MRINGKSFHDIWREMTIPYRIVVTAGSVFLVFATLYILFNLFSGLGSALKGEAGPLRIVNAVAANYLDPSLASDGQVAALAYTAVTAGGMRVSVATASLPCDRFNYNADVFTDKDEALLAPDGTTQMAQGRVRYETPSIVYDPADRANPWKVFAYRYFWMNNIAYAQRYSMIVMREGASPRGPWGRETWILASAPDHPPPPYQGLVQNFINPLSPALAGVSGYTRPSVVAHRGALLMSLVTLLPDGAMDRVILLASLDQAKTWGYVGTLFSRQQVAGIDRTLTRLAGAALVQRDGALYLSAVLGNDDRPAAGTWLFRITDPTTARLGVNAAGVPVPVLSIPLQSEAPTAQGGGYAAYAQGCTATGIISSEYSGLRNTYTLFKTLKHPPQ